MSISYTIKPLSPHAHLYEVNIVVENPDSNGQLFTLPNWIPGSYMIRDFAKNVVTMQAWCNDEAIALERVDKSSWRAPAGLANVCLTYQVYAWDLSVRTAHLDQTHAFFNGTSVFLCVEGQQNLPVSVQMLRPDGEQFKNWQLATTLAAKECDADGFGCYSAQDYDELIDHPVEMGTFTRVTFTACGVPHEVVLTGSFDADLDRIAKDLTLICETQIKFFGEPAPVDRYIFMVMVVGKGYGGLEHRASTALLVTRDHLPIVGDASTSDQYIEFLGLCSHEYFHTWNVKRIKPAEFVPYKLAEESYTQLLWFFEGITSYYDDIMLLRSGLITEAQYLNLMSKTITRVRRGAGREKQTVTESSFYAWNKFYKQDENAPNAIVSYYAKGALVSLCLDAKLRELSSGSVSLDNLMQLIWTRWLDTGKGMQEREPEELAAQLVGADLTEFFEHTLYSTEELPLEDALKTLGVEVHWRARRSTKDTGGGTVLTSTPSPWIGANVVDDAAGLKVTHVFNDQAAELAGLAAGDIIVALNKQVVSADAVAPLLARLSSKASVAVHYVRHGLLDETALPIMLAPVDTCSLVAIKSSETLDANTAADTSETSAEPATSAASVKPATSATSTKPDHSAENTTNRWPMALT